MQDYLKRLSSAAALALILLSSVGIHKFGRFDVAANQPVDWWPTYQHDASRRGYSTSRAPSTATMIWSADSSEIHYGSLSGAITCNGAVYATDTTFMVALNETDGSLMWRDDMTAYGTIDSTPSTDGTLLYVVSSGEKNVNGSLHALSCSDGHEVWSQKIGEWNGYWYSPAISQSYSLVLVSYQYHSSGALTNSSLWAFNTDTGALIWRYEVGYGEFYTSAAIDEASKKVFIVNEDSNPAAALYSLDLATGRYLNASYFTYTGHTGTPTVYNSKVYVESGSGPYYLYCFDENLNFQWKTRLNGGFASLGGLAAAYGAIFTGGDCIDASSGSIIWDNTGSSGYYPTTASPSVADGKVYWQDGGGFSCYNASTGKLIWNYAASLNSYGTSAISNGKAIFTTDRQGGLYVFGVNTAAVQVYIRSDGSVDPSWAPISSSDKVTYTFNGNISYPAYFGIVVQRSNIVIDGAGYTVQGNQSGNGLDLESISNVTIRNTNIEAFENGIYLYDSNNNKIVGNNATKNGVAGMAQAGIFLFGSSNNKVSGNSAADNNFGIWLGLSSNNTIFGNDVSGNSADGIHVAGFGQEGGIGSSENSLSENNVSNNGGGIFLWWVNGDSVIGNDVTNNYGNGLFLFSSSNNVLSENNVTNDSEYGIAIMWSPANNNTVSGNNVTGSSDGIWLQEANGNTLSKNRVTNGTSAGSTGIAILFSSGNTLRNNYLSNDGEYGILLDQSSSNNLYANNITGGVATYGIGIYLGNASDNIVSKNTVTRNPAGMGLFISSYNTFSENVLKDNEELILLGNSSSNMFCNNDFENTDQIIDFYFHSSPIDYTQFPSINIWNDGYPSGGNYWSRYVDVDVHSGPYQNETGSDGIWDHPYVIDANNTDLYPLVNPWVSTESLVVRGMDNRIYHRVYCCSNSSWASWNSLPTGATDDAPASVHVGNELDVVVRGMDGSTLWYAYTNLVTGTFSGWTSLSGATSSAPALTSNGTTLALVVRGEDNQIYFRFCDAASKNWTDWNALPSGATPDAPAAAMFGNNLHIVVRGMDGNSLWDIIVAGNGTVVRGWRLLSGASPSKPVLACSGVDNLCLVVRGMNDAIYYRNYTGSTDSWGDWNAIPTGATSDAPGTTVMANMLCTVVRGMNGSSLWCGDIDLTTGSFLGWTLLDGATPSAPTLTS